MRAKPKIRRLNIRRSCKGYETLCHLAVDILVVRVRHLCRVSYFLPPNCMSSDYDTTGNLGGLMFKHGSATYRSGKSNVWNSGAKYSRMKQCVREACQSKVKVNMHSDKEIRPAVCTDNQRNPPCGLICIMYPLAPRVWSTQHPVSKRRPKVCQAARQRLERDCSTPLTDATMATTRLWVVRQNMLLK